MVGTKDDVDAEVDRKAILVVGAGFGGLRFLIESLDLILRQHLDNSVEYIFVDGRPPSEFGRGVAWASDQNRNMRANMQYPERDIGSELTKVSEMSSQKGPTAADIFTQREKVGKMLSDLFQETRKRADNHGVPVTSIQDEVVNIQRSGASYKVVLKANAPINADCVVLALGHIPPTSFSHLLGAENYVSNAWELGAPQISKIPSNATVAVIGLGPTGVDTIIKLRDGGVEEVFGYSRSGTMQYPRPRPKTLAPKILTEDNLIRFARTPADLRMDTLLGMLAAEFLIQGVDWDPLFTAVKRSKLSPFESLSHGYQNCRTDSDWFGLITSFNEVIPIAWHLLDDDDRDEFLRLRDEVNDVLYGMASPHALRMLTELEIGTLHVFGGLKDISRHDTSGQFRVTHEENGQRVSKDFDYVINCTGFGKNIEQARIPLLQNLLSQKFLQVHKFGGAVVNFDTGQIIREGKGPPIQIYTLTGTLNIGTRIATNGLSAVAGSARRTAEAIHAYLFPDFDQFDPGDHADAGYLSRIREGLLRAARLGSRWQRALVDRLGP